MTGPRYDQKRDLPRHCAMVFRVPRHEKANSRINFSDHLSSIIRFESIQNPFLEDFNISKPWLSVHAG